MQNREDPNYWAILPANVRYDKELAANEKILYAEITALSNKYGFCFAKNKYFAELYGVKERAGRFQERKRMCRSDIRNEEVSGGVLGKK